MLIVGHPLRTPVVTGASVGVQRSLTGVRLLTPCPTQGGPRRRKVRSVSFPPKGGENSTRSLAPPFPTEPASLGFGGGPIFCRRNLPHFYHAYGRLNSANRLMVCFSNGAGTQVPRQFRRPKGAQGPKRKDAGGRGPSGESPHRRAQDAGKRSWQFY